MKVKPCCSASIAARTCKRSEKTLKLQVKKWDRRDVRLALLMVGAAGLFASAFNSYFGIWPAADRVLATLSSLLIATGLFV